MSLSGDDSDATVLDNEEAEGSMESVDEVCESPRPAVSSPPSPSILHTTLQSLIQQRSSSIRKESDSTHHALNQSDSELLSQEFPPLTLATTVAPPTVGTDTQQQVQDSTGNPHTIPPPTASLPAPHSEHTLPAIAQQQSKLLDKIRQLRAESPLTSETLAEVKGETADIEQCLKGISAANQTERRRLAEAHASLSRLVSSQEEFIAESQTLKQQLLGLANKQKLLLECFSRQKEIGDLLSQLALPPREMAGSSGVGQASTREPSENVISSLSSLHVSAPPTAVTSGAPVPSSSSAESLVDRASSTHSHHHHPPLSISSQKPTTLSGKTAAPAHLSEPVPLATLIKHGFLEPAQNCLSCHILGCQFRSTLLRDGSIQDSGFTHQLPRQWVKACWAQLGHHQKKISKKGAYSSVLHKERPLISYCENYSLKQVSSYLSQQLSGGCVSVTRSGSATEIGKGGVAPPSAAPTSFPQTRAAVTHPQPPSAQFDLSRLLHKGSVLLLPQPCTTRLDLPPGFWASNGVPLTPQLADQIHSDFDW